MVSLTSWEGWPATSWVVAKRLAGIIKHHFMGFQESEELLSARVLVFIETPRTLYNSYLFKGFTSSL